MPALWGSIESHAALDSADSGCSNKRLPCMTNSSVPTRYTDPLSAMNNVKIVDWNAV